VKVRMDGMTICCFTILIRQSRSMRSSEPPHQALHLTAAACGVLRVRRLTGRLGG
jgi:hypothetical protein